MSLALVSTLNMEKYADEKVAEFKKRCVAACKVVGGDYWNHDKGGAGVNRELLTKVAQDCADAVDKLEIK